MNKALVASIAALFTLMVFVGESQQQTAPTVHYGCTCMGQPQRERPQFGDNEASGFGGRGGQRRGPPQGGDRDGARGGARGGDQERPQPDMSQLPAAFSDTEANTVGPFFCACPN